MSQIKDLREQVLFSWAFGGGLCQIYAKFPALECACVHFGGSRFALRHPVLNT
jgi:hypothetical protein